MNLTEHSERACELVFKAIMKDETFNHSINDAWALAYSLDAWRPLWERMHINTIQKYWLILVTKVTKYGKKPHVLLAQPIHHLEAALRTLEEECPKCKGTGLVPKHNREYNAEPCTTCNAGKITLYEKLEREVKS